MFEAKDKMRISDILRKAQGDESKEMQLARQMAKSITKADKALRRGNAAMAAMRFTMAKVFFVRCGQLGVAL